MAIFFVIGNDNRTINIKEMLEKEKKITEDIKEAGYIYCGIPFSKDGENITGTDIACDDVINVCKNKILISGGISKQIRRRLEDEKIKYYDVMDMDEIATLNAIPTSEGAIQIAMENTDTTLNDSNILVLGFGKIGKILSKMLQGIGANVYCEARNQKDLALIKAMGYNKVNLKELDNYLSQFDVIFNTIPDMILDSFRLDKIKKTCVIIDLASSPGGTDFEYAKKIGITARLELGLPSRVAAKSATKYIKEAIDTIVTNDMN